MPSDRGIFGAFLSHTERKAPAGPKEREILIEGGLLHWLQEHGKQVA
jgi:hypothetical protein